MPVYAEDRTLCAVKIVKRGKVWAVYPLTSIRCAEVDRSPYTGETKFGGCKFAWSKKPRGTYSYKPYEDRDVYSSQTAVIPYVHRMCHHAISYDPFMRKR